MSKQVSLRQKNEVSIYEEIFCWTDQSVWTKEWIGPTEDNTWGSRITKTLFLCSLGREVKGGNVFIGEKLWKVENWGTRVIHKQKVDGSRLYRNSWF